MADNKIRVNNLCAWPLYFNRITGQGSFSIPESAKNYPLDTEDEIMAQIQNGNRFFVGTDGLGSHARIQIVDDDVRKRVFGLNDDEVSGQMILTVESVRDLLSIRSKSKFNEQLQQLVHTEAEKKMLVDLAFESGAANAESWKVDALREIAATASL